jgi:hypothetical protein
VQRHGCAGTGDAQHALTFFAKHEVAAGGGDVAHVSHPVSGRSPTARTSGGIAVINFRQQPIVRVARIRDREAPLELRTHRSYLKRLVSALD